MEQLEHSAEKLGEFSASREVRSLKSKKWWSCRSGWIILAHIRITRRYTWHSGHSTFRVAVRSDVHFRIIKSVPFIYVAYIYFVRSGTDELSTKVSVSVSVSDIGLDWWRTNLTTASCVRSRNVLHREMFCIALVRFSSTFRRINHVPLCTDMSSTATWMLYLTSVDTSFDVEEWYWLLSALKQNLSHSKMLAKVRSWSSIKLWPMIQVKPVAMFESRTSVESQAYFNTVHEWRSARILIL